MTARRDHTISMALVVALACASPVASIRPRPFVTTMRPCPLPQTEVRIAPRLEPRFWAELDGSEANPGIDAVLGTLRVTVRGNESHVADEFTPEPIVAAVHDGDRWVFADEGGRVYASRTFTGPLESRGRVSRDARVNQWLRERLILVDPHGVAWSTDGSRDIAPVAALSAPVRQAAFVSRERGIATLVGGGAMRTEDGGRSWTRVETHSAIVDAHVTYGRYELRRNGGRDIVWSDERATSHMYDEYRGRDLASGDRLLPRVAAAAIARHPRLLPSLSPLIGAVPLGVDRVAATIDERLVAIDVATGRVVHTYREVPTDCSPSARWGSDVAVTCGDDDESLWRLDGTTDTAAPVAIEPRASDSTSAERRTTRDVTFASDGARAVFLGACAHDATPEAIARSSDLEQEFACLRDSPLGEWRTIPLPTPLFDVVGLDSRTIQGRFRGDTIILDPLVGSARVLSFAPVPDEPSAYPNDVCYALDGTAYALDRAAFPRWLFVSADRAEPLVYRLPRGVSALELRDRRHGIAVGADISDLWTTDDGGAHWRRIDVPHDGVVQRLEAYHEPPVPAIRCESDTCVVGDQIEVRGEGPARIEPIDPSHPLIVTRFVHAGIPMGPPLGPYRCDAPGVHVPFGTNQPSETHARVRSQLRGSVEHVSVDWSGADGAGPYDAHSPEAVIARTPRPYDSTRYAVLATTRASALVVRIDEMRGADACAIAVVTPHSAFVPLDPTTFGLPASERLTVDSAVALDDGTYAVHVRTPMIGWGDVAHAAFVVRADRSIAATRRLDFTGDERVGSSIVLGIRHQQAGLVWTEPRGRESWFFPASVGADLAPIAIPTGDANDAVTCIARSQVTPQWVSPGP